MTNTVVYFTESACFGGAEKVVLASLRGLDRTRWRPVLVHYPAPGIEPLVLRAQALEVETRTLGWMHRSRDARWLFRFAGELRRLRPALFHAHLFRALACTYGIAAAVLARVPRIIATQHLFKRPSTRHDLVLHKMVSLAVDRYIAVSEQLARDVRPHLMSAEKLRVIHNGIPLEPFNRAPDATLRFTLTGGLPRPLVLTLARLEKQKGLRYLVEAVAGVPEVAFVIAGDGPERPALEAQARAAGVADRVTFLGWCDDVPELLAACDVFVLPSLFEGLPLSVLEAMAAGKPIVATKIGGTDEAIEDGVSGLLVPPQDAGALAEAIRNVISDSVLARRLADSGRARARKEFSAETMVSRTVRLYEELMPQ